MKTFEKFDEDDPFGDAISELPSGDSKRDALRRLSVSYTEIKTCPNYQKIIQNYQGATDVASRVQIKNKTVKIAIKNPINKKTYYYLAYCTGDLRKDDPALGKVTTLNEYPRETRSFDQWDKLLGQLIYYIDKDFGKARERLEFEGFKSAYNILDNMPEFKELMKEANSERHYLGTYGFGIELPLDWEWSDMHKKWRQKNYLLLYLFPSGNTLFQKHTPVRNGKKQWMKIGNGNRTAQNMLSNVRSSYYIYQRNFKPKPKPTNPPPPLFIPNNNPNE